MVSPESNSKHLLALRSFLLFAAVTAVGLRMGPSVSAVEPREKVIVPDSHPRAFSADGKTLVLALDNEAIVWDITRRKEIRKVQTNGRVQRAAISFDGKTVATLADSAEIWDVESGKQTGSFPLGGLAFAITISKDGKTVAAGTVDGKNLIWSAGKRDVVALTNDGKDRIDFLAFTPNGKTLISGSSNVIDFNVWDVEKKQLVGPIGMGGRGSTEDSLLSADGKTLLVLGLEEGCLTLFDVATRKKKTTLKNFYDQPSSMNAMIFTPSRKLINFSAAGAIKVWDLTNGKQVSTTKVKQKETMLATISADGKTLITIEGGEGLLLWDLSAIEKGAK